GSPKTGMRVRRAIVRNELRRGVSLRRLPSRPNMTSNIFAQCDMVRRPHTRPRSSRGRPNLPPQMRKMKSLLIIVYLFHGIVYHGPADETQPHPANMRYLGESWPGPAAAKAPARSAKAASPLTVRRR